MKSAHEWLDTIPLSEDDEPMFQEVEEFIAFLLRVQLDAYKAGLTKAAEIVTRVNTDYDGCAEPKGKIIHAILAVRDAENEQPK